MRINLGIRRRLAPLIGQQPAPDRAAEQPAALDARARPIIYYGDEIGMGDNIYLGDRNGVRTPMQWNGDRNAGFSGADFARALLPARSWTRSTATRRSTSRRSSATPTSLLNWMRRMIALRKRYQGVRPRHDRVPPPGEPHDPGLPAHVRGRDDPLRRQPLALRAAGRARPVRPTRATPPSSCSARCEFPMIGEHALHR